MRENVLSKLSWILNLSPNTLSMKAGFQILIVSGIPDFLSSILDSKAPGIGIPKARIPRIPAEPWLSYMLRAIWCDQKISFADLNVNVNLPIACSKN